MRAKKLVAYTGGLTQLFEASNKQLALIPGVGKEIVRQLNRDEALREAEKELRFVEKNQLETHFYLDKTYPHRLKHCEDGPILMYGAGKMDFDVSHVVGIVGTRECSEYGIRLTERLIESLAPFNPLIVSGLAYGIDTIAHRAAVQLGVQTVGVLGHSLDRIYPNTNKSLAEKMCEHGGLLSEFDSGTKPDRENFPQRNRIVAGMCDVIVVVETAVRGGSMITAKLASGYNRDVMAFPGPVGARLSSGCNHLIKTNQAALIESADDLIYQMGWQVSQNTKPTQKQLFVDLNEEEQILVKALEHKQKDSLDNLSLACSWPISKTSTTLLELEFKGVVKSLPGKTYALA